MKKTVSNILLCVTMVVLIGLLPAVVFAADGDGVQTVLDVSQGKITLGDGTVDGYAPDGTHITTIDPDGYILIGTSTDSEKTVSITGGDQNVTLRNLNIDVSATKRACAFLIAKDCPDNVTITLEEGSVNVLKSGEECAGLSKGQSFDETDIGYLTIEGSGSLTAVGGMFGAGIGGAYYSPHGYSSQNITIHSGNVTATGGTGAAGIGGGVFAPGYNITINGGTVNVTGGESGAGIGGGRSYPGYNITINGGTVNVKGGASVGSGNNTVGGGAGIGGGSSGDGHDITINGGTIKTEGGGYGAGIGGGHYSAEFSSSRARSGHGYNITINGGYVEANGGYYGAGIGSGGNCFEYHPEYYTISIWMPGAEGYNIKIYGGTVIARGGSHGAGIGGGEGGDGHDIDIGGLSTNVTAIGSSYAAGIGGGGGYLGRSSGGDGYNIRITDARVYAEGDAAGIGAGGNNLNGVSTQPYYSGNAKNITITDSIVTAKGGYYAGGIGSVWSYTSTSDIWITGGSVFAQGRESQIIGNEKTYVTPKNNAHQTVYLLTIDNPTGEDIYIDGTPWSARTHLDGGTTVYAYVTGKEHTVETELTKTVYSYSGGKFTVKSQGPSDNARQIIFDANGGSGTMANAYVAYGGKYTMPECGFTAPAGYYFTGWASSKTNGTLRLVGEEVTFTNNCTMYAIWTKYSVIRFNANGGSGTMTSVQVKPEENYTLPGCSFTAPAGFRFKGWALSAYGTIIQTDIIRAGGDMELFAIWTSNDDGERSVLDVSKGNITIGDGTLDAYTSDGTHLTSPDPDGYILTGYSNQDAKKVVINGGTHDLILRDLTVDVYHVAWAHAFSVMGNSEMTITLEGNNTVKGGEGRHGLNFEGVASLTITAESTGTLTAEGKGSGISMGEGDLTISGGFINASSINGGSGTVTINGGRFAAGDVEANTIYGITPAEGYGVTDLGGDYPYGLCELVLVRFDANGGEGEMAAIRCDDGTFILPECTFTAPYGQLFAGWAYTADGAIITAESIDVTTTITLYALWQTDGEPTVFDVSKGYITIDNDTVDGYTTEGIRVTTPDPDGYVITGYSDEDGKKVHILGDCKITLRDLTVDVSSVKWAWAFAVSGTVEITLEGTNVLCGGIERAGLNVQGGQVTITAESTGALIASTESAFYGAAAIGGNYNSGNGTIIINGGFIQATAGNSDADPIGAGENGTRGPVIINGGYFANGNTEENTVYGIPVAEAYMVSYTGEGDYPYEVKVSYITGDINGDGTVDIDDALRLFQHSLMPDLYPLNYPGGIDFTGNGILEIGDALRLFQYSLMPDLYPLV